MDNVNLEKLAKELLKKIIDNNRELSEQEKVGIKVIIGARSAIFAPIENIGVIIIDEEHDPEKLLEKCLQYMG